MNPAVRFIWFNVLFLLAAFFAGCRTEPEFVESSGISVRDQAATVPSLSDGKTAGKQTGSQTMQVIDWNSRIGNYTYQQAVAELGLPNRKVRLGDGKVAFKWFIQPTGSPRFNHGMYYYGNNGFSVNQAIYNNRMLQLTFDTNGTLTAWSKNY